MAYDRSYWKDHVTDQSGEVIQQGTLLDQQHFNNMELGISDMTLAGAIMQFKAVQDGYNYADEMHTATLAQTGSKWPFNNTPTTIALAQLRESTNYGVEVTVLAYSGGRLGNIRVTDRARNGFKLVHDGSATTVKVQIRVTGGMTDPAPTEEQEDKSMKIIEKNEGKKINYNLTGTKLDFADGALTLDLARYQQDDTVTRDIMVDSEGYLTTGRGLYYAAQVEIPARKYTETVTTAQETDAQAEGGENTEGMSRETVTRTPEPLDTEDVTLYLFAIDGIMIH